MWAKAIWRRPYLTGWLPRDIPDQPQTGTRLSHVKPQIQGWRCTDFCKTAVVPEDFTLLCQEIHIADKSRAYRSIQTFFFFPLKLFILSTMRFLSYIQAFAGRKHHLFLETVQLVSSCNELLHTQWSIIYWFYLILLILTSFISSIYQFHFGHSRVFTLSFHILRGIYLNTIICRLQNTHIKINWSAYWKCSPAQFILPWQVFEHSGDWF